MEQKSLQQDQVPEEKVLQQQSAHQDAAKSQLSSETAAAQIETKEKSNFSILHHIIVSKKCIVLPQRHLYQAVIDKAGVKQIFQYQLNKCGYCQTVFETPLKPNQEGRYDCTQCGRWNIIKKRQEYIIKNLKEALKYKFLAAKRRPNFDDLKQISEQDIENLEVIDYEQLGEGNIRCYLSIKASQTNLDYSNKDKSDQKAQQDDSVKVKTEKKTSLYPQSAPCGARSNQSKVYQRNDEKNSEQSSEEDSENDD